MTELSKSPARPRARRQRPSYPRGLSVGAVVVAAACASVTVACGDEVVDANENQTSTGHSWGGNVAGGMPNPWGGGGVGGEAGAGGDSQGGAGGSDVGGAGGAHAGGHGMGGNVAGGIGEPFGGQGGT